MSRRQTLLPGPRYSFCLDGTCIQCPLHIQYEEDGKERVVIVYPTVPLPAFILPGTETDVHRRAFEMCMELLRAAETGRIGENIRRYGLS